MTKCDSREVSEKTMVIRWPLTSAAPRRQLRNLSFTFSISIHESLLFVIKYLLFICKRLEIAPPKTKFKVTVNKERPLKMQKKRRRRKD